MRGMRLCWLTVKNSFAVDELVRVWTRLRSDLYGVARRVGGKVPVRPKSYDFGYRFAASKARKTGRVKGGTEQIITGGDPVP